MDRHPCRCADQYRVLLSGAAIAITDYRPIDLLVELAIGLSVVNEGLMFWSI